MALEVVKAFTLEHVRWLTPLEEHAVRVVKGAAIGKGEATAEALRIYDLVTEAVRKADCWILCDCLPEGSEQPVIVPARGPNRIRLGNRPDAPLPHDGDCVFRLRGTSRGGTRYWFNPLTGDGQGGDPGGPDSERDGGSRPRRPVPEVAYLLKCFIREARLHTLAGAERFASPADALAELGRAAAAFPVAPGIQAAEVLFTDPARWRSGEVRERLDVVARSWPRGPPRCGFLCWIAYDLEGHDINRKTPGAGHVRVASPVVSPVIHDRRVEGPFLFLGVVAPSGDRQEWECRMAYAQPIAAAQLPIPVESGYERQALLSLPRLVRDLRSDTDLREALGGSVEVELQKPLFPVRVREGLCLPDILLTVTRPGGSGHGPGDPDPGSPDGLFDDGSKARYVIEVMGVRRRGLREEEGRDTPPDGAARPGDPSRGEAVRVRPRRPGAAARQDYRADRQGSHLALDWTMTGSACRARRSTRAAAPE